MDISNSKLIAAVSMSIATYICTMIPVILFKRLENEGSGPRNFRVVNFLNCFGGGVFMATCLLHLLPDVQEQIVSIFKNLNLDLNYPLAEFLLCVGFLVVLITEQIVLSCQENGIKVQISNFTHQHSHGEPLYQNYGSINENTENSNTNPSINVNESQHAIQPDEENDVHPHEVSFHQDLNSHSILRSLMLLFALSLHSVFEGLAIGLQSSVQNVIRILLAVLIHKSIIAFTLGLNLTHSKLKRANVFIGSIFFSLTSPIGIVIGLVVVDFVSGLPMLITSAILQGIAAGTFLYVTFFEVLPHELNSREDRILKMFFLVLGFSVVSALLQVFPS